MGCRCVDQDGSVVDDYGQTESKNPFWMSRINFGVLAGMCKFVGEGETKERVRYW
ncbi:hypothetical protein D8674_031883 [Pyrus ussuriensis x Pyrus communis]|uniref:Uncharacterized protein n=1 Tax=Pyrus ussuriensis x Pyrus communis TaxID=2448454 RepID=A0A5N5F129_9ROSA|nr:hypothetical protein D8674_031883 [Pyrus ussuriensis x Pyrus communis]